MHLYIVCAVVVSDAEASLIRAAVKPFLLPGQVKFHWKIEPESRRHAFLSVITNFGFDALMVCDQTSYKGHQERQRRKALELLYAQLELQNIFDVTLEARTPSQNRLDIAHIAGLKSGGNFARFRLSHLRGGDDPILWIPDVLLGARHALRKGQESYADALGRVHLVELLTMGSD
jgi:hypothetical protein